MAQVWTGLGLGIFLFLAKLGIFHLLTSVKNQKTGDLEQRIMKKWIFFGEQQPLKDRINDSTFLLVCVDTLFGYLGMSTLTAFNGGIIAMIGIAAYTIVCAFVLGQQFIFKWFYKKLTFKKPRKCYVGEDEN